MDEAKPKKLLDQVREALRVKHYAYRTEEAYVDWIRRYILFHGKRHPQDMGLLEIEEFLTHLAVQRRFAASTYNQALCALLFLYRYVIRQDIDLSISAFRAQQSHYLPTVLSQEEAIGILEKLFGANQWMAQLLYARGKVGLLTVGWCASMELFELLRGSQTSNSDYSAQPLLRIGLECFAKLKSPT